MPENGNLFDDQTVRRLFRMLAEWEAREDAVELAPEEPPLAPPAWTQPRWGKLDGDLTAGSTQDVTFWMATGGGWHGWDVTSGITQECYGPPLQSSTIASTGDTWVLAARINGRWVVLYAACPTP